MKKAVVIGGGPAGLFAAEILASRHIATVVVDAKPTVGRKLLMAGKSGLNLTKDEPFAQFLAKYTTAAEWLAPMLGEFSNEDIQNWAQGLGQSVFTGSSGRVFPRTMKASPLLRTWITRLAENGVDFRTRWHWTGWRDAALRFDTPDGEKTLTADATVLALGGASWSRLGSDGTWSEILQASGVTLEPFQAANVGVRINWSSHMARHFGTPLKAVGLRAGDTVSRGEFVITKNGLEGGGIYDISRAVRHGTALSLDLVPDIAHATVTARLTRPQGKTSLANHLRKTLKLDSARLALLQEFARPLPNDPAHLASIIKAVSVKHDGLSPIDEAISTAGGIDQQAVDENLMLRAIPGVFVAGEMLDWEAPTGGYLLSACLATGRWAGLGAARYLGPH